jgi:hypothetical protein
MENTIPQRFVVELWQYDMGGIELVIVRSDGKTRTVHVPQQKVRAYTVLNGPIKETIDFLFGNDDT